MAALIAAGALAYGFRAWRDPQRHFLRAQAALRAGDEATARHELDSLAGFPQYTLHRHFLNGALLLRAGNFSEALNEFGFAGNHPELEIGSLVLSGQALYQMQRAGNAKLLWDRALELDPNCADAHRWLGILYYDLGAMDHALGHLQRVSELEPLDPRPDRLLGLINKDYERPEVAVKHYRESLRRSQQQSDVQEIYLELAACQTKLHDHAAALATLATCPPSPKKLTLQAECHRSLGDTRSAEQCLEEVLKLAPDHLDALLLKGTIQMEDGELTGALATLRTATEKHPKDYYARFRLARILRQLGDAPAAEEQERLVEELRVLWKEFSDLHIKAIREPDNAEVRYEIGIRAQQLGRLDLATTWLKAALAIDPTHAKARTALESVKGPAGPQDTKPQ